MQLVQSSKASGILTPRIYICGLTELQEQRIENCKAKVSDSIFIYMLMWWLIGSASDIWGRGPGFESGHNDSDALQDHSEIK